MSREERASNGQVYCLLPEMVSSARKDVYFFIPDYEIEYPVAKNLRRSETSSFLSADELFEWNEFEFRTVKTGAYGPTKSECIDYYSLE